MPIADSHSRSAAASSSVSRRLHGHVDRAGQQVQLADDVAGRLVGRADALVVLVVLGAEPVGAEQAPAAQVDEARRQLQVRPVPGDPVQLDQRGLDLRVPADALLAVRAVAGDEQVREAPGDGDQLLAVVGAGEPVGVHGGDRGLDQVPGAVQLVAGA